MRLIDEAYLQARKVHGVINNVEGDFVSGATIAHAPTVDAIEVVKCKDCKYRTEFGNCGHLRQHGILPVVYPYDFCSYGERKDTDNAT